MVGMVIAMMTVLSMTQVFALFEGNKRTTTSGADAQDNGVAALATIERDVRMAGYGLVNSTVLGSGGCNEIQWFYNGATQSPISAAPVTIIDGGGGLSDTLTATYGNGMAGLSPATLTANMPQPSAELDVDLAAAFNVNDLFVVAQNGVCVMMQATTIQVTPGKIQHNPGGSAPYNPSSAQIPASWPAYTQGAQVFDLGQITSRSYSSASANLQFAEVPGLTATPLVSNIVNIQAQYGLAATGSNVVNCWVNATGAGTNACDGNDWSSTATATNMTAANAARIKAIRIAVVARSNLPEKPSVTGGACDATTQAPTSWSGGPTIDLSADPNWRCYRYKVFQTIVPLRNVIWANL